MCPVTGLLVLCERFMIAEAGRYSEDLNSMVSIQVSLLKFKCLLKIKVVDIVWLSIQK